AETETSTTRISRLRIKSRKRCKMGFVDDFINAREQAKTEDTYRKEVRELEKALEQVSDKSKKLEFSFALMKVTGHEQEAMKMIAEALVHPEKKIRKEAAQAIEVLTGHDVKEQTISWLKYPLDGEATLAIAANKQNLTSERIDELFKFLTHRFFLRGMETLAVLKNKGIFSKEQQAEYEERVVNRVGKPMIKLMKEHHVRDTALNVEHMRGLYALGIIGEEDFVAFAKSLIQMLAFSDPNLHYYDVMEAMDLLLQITSTEKKAEIVGREFVKVCIDMIKEPKKDQARPYSLVRLVGPDVLDCFARAKESPLTAKSCQKPLIELMNSKESWEMRKWAREMLEMLNLPLQVEEKEKKKQEKRGSLIPKKVPEVKIGKLAPEKKEARKKMTT
ncbi:MAG: hypothetical protein ABIH99_04830, partial [Candidatus Micrarchaeota archaeon]